MSQLSKIVNASGHPFTYQPAHYGADLAGPELMAWQPELLSADGALLPELDILKSRTEDMIRNHGLLSGAVQIHLDNVVGPNLKLSAQPDWQALGQDQEWAREWSRIAESKFNLWANDLGRYCDTTRRHTFGGLIAQAYRSYLTSFEILALADWLPNRGSRYATAIQMVDTSRLQNPNAQRDTETLRGGVYLRARTGAPWAYSIASNLAGDPMQFGGMTRWRRVPRETSWGRQIVIHLFDADRPGQTRGRHGLVSVIGRSKMLDKFEQSTLQAAILNAMYAAVIESSMDWESVGAALGTDGASDPTLAYLQNRVNYHKGGHARYNGVKIPHLFPGEQFKLTSPQHPSAAFENFEGAFLRHLAGGFNLSYEEFSRDYSKSNYSSTRAALLQSYKTFFSKRTTVAGAFATAGYALWLEEAMEKGDVERPPGAPAFNDAKTAWCGCTWIGPGRGHIDPLKEKKATREDFAMGLTTLQKEAAERGEDWEHLLQQRAVEIKRSQEIAEQMGIDPNLLLMTEPAPDTPDTIEVQEA